MSKMADHEMGKQEAIERLKGEIIALNEKDKGLDPRYDEDRRIETLEKIAIINDQIETIQNS